MGLARIGNFRRVILVIGGLRLVGEKQATGVEKHRQSSAQLAGGLPFILTNFGSPMRFFGALVRPVTDFPP